MQRVVAVPIATYLPSEVVYFDGTSAVLPEEYVLKEGNLRLYVPKWKVEDVANALKGSGFHEEKLEFYKGEECREVLRHYDLSDGLTSRSAGASSGT